MTLVPTIDHLNALVAAHDPRASVLRVDRPPSGIANTVLLVTTTRGDLVLKIYADDVSRWKPRKEQAICAHLRALGIPAPDVHTVDLTRRVVPFAYSLADRIAGEPYSDVVASLDETENARLCRVLGEYLGRMHTTTFDRFGDVLASDGGLTVGPVHDPTTGAPGEAPGPIATWRELHDAIVRSRLGIMRGTRFADLIPAVETYVATHRDLLHAPIVPRMLHLDLHRGNVLVAGEEIAGILDVEEALAGHNEFDLMRTELAMLRGEPPSYRRAFVDAYERHVPLDEGYEERRAFYDVSRTLAWIRSLILHGDDGAQGELAHTHLLALTST